MRSKHWQSLAHALATTRPPYAPDAQSFARALQWQADCDAIMEVCRLYQSSACRFDSGKWLDGLERDTAEVTR